MRKGKIKLFGVLASLVLLFTLAIPTLAVWSSTVTVTPPPYGAEVDSYVSVKKTTTERTWSITGVEEYNTLDPYARLVVGNTTKSSWAPVRHSQTLTYSDNAAAQNTSVRTRAKSNNLEPSRNQIKYQFNPY